MPKTLVRMSVLGSLQQAPRAVGSDDHPALAEQLAFLREAEDAGLLHIAGSADMAQNGMYGTMALVAEHTRRAKVGPYVTVPLIRWPSVAAGEISMTQWISKGRAFFGVGTGGGPATAMFSQMGTKLATIAEVREYALAVKGLCAGEQVHYHGHDLKLWGTAEPVNIPLFLDVSGPKGMALAGEIADGAFVAYGISKESVEHMKAEIGKGAQAAGRDPNEIELWWVPPIMLGANEAEAIERVKFYLATRIHAIFAYPEVKVVPEDLHEPIRAFRREYHPTEFARPDLSFNGDLLDKYGLTAWAVDRHAIVGPPERMIERIQEVASWGVTNIMFGLWGSSLAERRRNLHTFAEKVLPHVS